MPDPTINTPVSTEVAGVARQWEAAYEKAPEAVTGFIGEVLKNSGKFFAPAVEVAGGAYVFTKAGEKAFDALQGKDVTGFKASSSNTDAAIATTVYGIASLTGLGLSVHGAIKAVQAACEVVEKA